MKYTGLEQYDDPSWAMKEGSRYTQHAILRMYRGAGASARQNGKETRGALPPRFLQILLETLLIILVLKIITSGL
jgi:hypothetical protein